MLTDPCDVMMPSQMFNLHIAATINGLQEAMLCFWLFLESASVLVKIVLDRVHPMHHVPHVNVVQFVTLHEEIVMKEIRIAGRVIKEQWIELLSEKS